MPACSRKMSKRTATHHDTRGSSGAVGQIKVKLISGKTLLLNHPGPLPSILLLEADNDSAPGARVACLRVDVDVYRQMDAKEMIKSGLVKPAPREMSGKTEEGGAPEPERTPRTPKP